MGPVCGPLVLLLSLLCSEALANINVKLQFEPMVAFVNGKPAMHYGMKGWEASRDTGYLSNRFEVLKFCKRVYADFNVKNVMELNDPITIKDWCRKGKHDCGSHKVIPYKCLVGEFQSDALLVPEGCTFDHVHEKTKCLSHDAWKKIAAKKCKATGDELKRYGMLIPCDTDLFSGVEYVCCPSAGGKAQVAPPKKEKVTKDNKPMRSGRDKKHHMMGKKKMMSPGMKMMMNKKMGGRKEDIDVYQKYKHSGLKDKYSFEHQKFKQAMEKLDKTEQEKVTAVMKEWANARERIQEMKTTDPKGAARMEKEVTERFKKTYQALEQEGKSMKNQLLDLHEQHISANINNKKRNALDHLTDALNEEKPDADIIIKFLQRYIRAEGKDRQHIIKHFAHMRNHHPENLEKTRKYTLKHLRQIDDRVNQSLQLVTRLQDKDLVLKIQNRVRDFMTKYHKNIDQKLTENLLKPIPAVTDAVIVEQYKNKMKEQNVLKQKSQIKSNSLPEKKMSDKKPVVEKKMKQVDKKVPKKPMDFPKEVDDETYEDEHLYVENKQPQHNNAAKDTISLEKNELFESKHETVKNLVSAGSTTVGIVVGALVAFVIIIIAIVMVRRRSQRSPADNGFIEVSQAVSPEERHVQNMQSNGYENPTYKFFEMQGQ